MAKYTVTTPVPGHSGAVGGVHFADGVAVVDEQTHAGELAYFRAQGYGCVELDASAGDPVARAARIEELSAELDKLQAEEAAAAEAAAEAEAESDDEEPDDEEPDDEEPEMPRKSASAEEWRTYAKAKGMPAENADAMGRDQLVEHYTKEAAK